MIFLKNIISYLILALLLIACASNNVSTNDINKKIKISYINQKEASKKLVNYSYRLLGTPYKYGGNSVQEGFDCSGLVVYVYKNVLGVKLPRTTNQLALASTKISKSKLKKGDLVFFNTTGRNFSHVGIYIGKNQFIHAPKPNDQVKINNLNDEYYLKRFTGARTFF